MITENKIMPFTHINALVRLKVDVPNLQLHRGIKGVVVSLWLSPGDLYFEVEFPKPAGSSCVRALLRSEQLEAIDP